MEDTTSIVCRRCQISKPLDEFYVDSRRGYRVKLCKKCWISQSSARHKADRDRANAAQQKWREEHREESRRYQREWARARRLSLRAQIIDLLGGACVECGTAERIVLDVDHVEGDGATHRRELRGLSHRAYQQDILRCIADGSRAFQLLCGNCHRRKTRAEGRNGRPRVD